MSTESNLSRELLKVFRLAFAESESFCSVRCVSNLCGVRKLLQCPLCFLQIPKASAVSVAFHSN